MQTLRLKRGIAAIGFALTYTAMAIDWTGGGTDELFDPQNWGGEILDVTKDGTFWGGADLSLVMSEDYTVKALFFYRNVEVDFKGKTMTVGGGDIRPLRGAHVKFSNGFVNETTGTLRIGQVGANSLLTLAGSTFAMTVPSMLIGQSEGSSFSGLIVENGATLTSNNGMPLANTTVNTSNNYAIVRGEGSRINVTANNVTIGHQGTGGNNWVEVSDKAEFVCVKTLVGNHINCPNNFLRIKDGGSYTNNGDMVIGNVAGCNGNRIEVLSGGDLYVKDNFYISSNGSRENELIVSNASAIVGKQMFLSVNNDSAQNIIRIIDGSLTTGTGFRFCWGTESDGNRVILRNGRVSTLGILVGKNDPSVVKDNRIVFEGTNDTWVVSGNDISLKSGATLEVDFPEEGRDPTVTCLEGLSANLNLDGTMRIIVNAQRHVRKLEQRTTYPLVRVNGQVAATALDHVSVDDPDHVTVELTADRKGIDIVVKPGRKGLTVVIR